MKTSSCKQKGRRCAQRMAQLVSNHFTIPVSDIRITSSGTNGPDIEFPEWSIFGEFDFECKNQERLNIWKSISQAEGFKSSKRKAVVFTKNRTDLYIAMKLEDYLKDRS